MKRFMAISSILLIFATILSGCNFSRLGTDIYYLQINEDGKKLNKKENDSYTNYEYELTGFDESGKDKTIKFKTDKNLRKGAFLRIYYSEKKGVKSWEEIKKDEIPTKVKEKLGVK